MRFIVPKSKALGIDICGVNKYTYIVRSDLGCYMRTTDFEAGSDLVVRTIHPKCLGGYYYLAHEDEYFYIINRDTYRRVTNLNKGTDCVLYTLHPNCRGGDHYISAHGCFYIVFQERGVYRRTLNMQKDYQGADFPLHPLSMDGLFYWGTKEHVHFLKYKNKADLKWVQTGSLRDSKGITVHTVSRNVVNFLPGGIAFTNGPTCGKWQYVKSVINDSEQPITWIKKINRNVDGDQRGGGGRNNMSMNIEEGWQVKTRQEAGELTQAILRYQLSLPPKFGGSNIIIDEGKWMGETCHEDESVSLVMEPAQRIYCWQYKLSLGERDVLFWRDMKIEYDSKPPVEPPPYAEIINQDLHEGFACSKIKLYYGAFEDRDRELCMPPRSSLD